MARPSGNPTIFSLLEAEAQGAAGAKEPTGGADGRAG